VLFSLPFCETIIKNMYFPVEGFGAPKGEGRGD